MKITNKETVEAINIMSSMGDKILPRKLSFIIGKNLEILQTQIYRPYYNELKKVQKKYITQNKDGKEECKNEIAYNEELQELLDIENEVTIHLVTEELLDECDKNDKYSALSLKEAVILMKMLKK